MNTCALLDKGDGEEKISESILDVGVQKAIGQIRWDEDGFYERGGVYDWSSPTEQGGSFGGAAVVNFIRLRA